MSVSFPDAALAGPLAVRLVNTEYVYEGRAIDALGAWDDVMRWYAADAGGIPVSEARGSQHAERAALRELKALRSAIRAVFEGHVSGTLDRRTAAPLNAFARRRLAAPPLIEPRDGRATVRRARSVRTGPAQLSVLVAEEVVALLAGPVVSRLKQCASDTCVLYFVDESKARSRTWCSMRTCGNRHKASKHYQRRRGGA